MKALFVGCGSIGARHIKNLEHVCADDWCEIEVLRHGHTPLREDLKPLVSRECFSWDEVATDYDYVFVTNPTSLHLQTVGNLTHRCKAIFLEKPATATVEEANALIQILNTTPCYVACPLRYTGVLQFAKDILEPEHVLCAQATCSSYLPDWRPGQDYRRTYSAQSAQGGGVRLDLIHEWDYLTWLFGFPANSMCSYARLSSLEIDVEDYASYVAAYPTMRVELHLDYFGRDTVRSLQVFTEEHTYLFDIAHASASCDGQRLREWNEDPNDKYLRELRTFLSIIERGENPNSVEHAAEVMRLCIGNYVSGMV